MENKFWERIIDFLEMNGTRIVVTLLLIAAFVLYIVYKN